MTYSKILLLLTASMFCNLTFAQSIQKPTLSQNSNATLIIDSIPITKSKDYHLTGINKDTNDYRLFFGATRTSDYPSFSISRVRPFLVINNNAFTHRSLFDPMSYNSFEQQSWDNPFGTDSFAFGVLAGSVQLISGIFKK